MKKTLLLVLTGTLALSVEGCSYISKFGEKAQEIENPPPISVKAEASQEGKSSESEALTLENEKQDGVNRTQNVAGLIPSTNPDVRIRSNQKGRKDPFATISVVPKVEVKTDPKTVDRPNRRPINNRPLPQPRRELPPRVRKPPEINSTPTMETAETNPKAEIAENVLITGFIELGDRVKIILQAPEEASSRYVEVGQYVSNGQVLVKRIEPGFPTPIVVLEESGIEVTKVIGTAETEPTEEQANNFLPLPPS